MIIVKLKEGDRTLPFGSFTREQIGCEEIVVGAVAELRGAKYEIEKINDKIASMLTLEIRKVQ